MRTGSDSGDDGLGGRIKIPLSQRFRSAFLQPGAPDAPPPGVAAGTPDSIPELEILVKRANDKERLVGVLGAPIAAAIATVIVDHLVAYDPAQYLANGQPNHLHVALSLYHELLAVSLGLAFLMMVTGLLRKRMILGMVMGLYGLGIFNLHYWGFGIPYVMAGAWLLVRQYRLQRSLREATGTGPAGSSFGRTTPSLGRPGSNKRYTPPSSRRRARRTNEI